VAFAQCASAVQSMRHVLLLLQTYSPQVTAVL